MFGANGMVVYRQKRAEYNDLQGHFKVLQDENEKYSGSIKALQDDPQAIEKEARDQFHYVRPGEVVYVNPAAPPPPSTRFQYREAVDPVTTSSCDIVLSTI